MSFHGGRPHQRWPAGSLPSLPERKKGTPRQARKISRISTRASEPKRNPGSEKRHEDLDRQPLRAAQVLVGSGPCLQGAAEFSQDDTHTEGLTQPLAFFATHSER